jgi:hypothetical protein
MPTIAISYRRSDSSAIAGRIYDHLTAQYGTHAVFMDIDNIPFGIDFRSHIRETLQRTDVLIAVIGANWLGRNAAGVARMQEQTDPVRVEIETALECKTSIIPALIDGAKMPDSSELPATFGNFAYLNAADVSSGRDFRAHMERLIAAIDRIVTPGASLEAIATAHAAKSRTDVATVDPTPVSPNWRNDVLRYFLVPLVVLLVAHYAIVNSLNLNADYLRLASVLVPFAAGFAFFCSGVRSAGAATAFALALGLVGVIGMTISESLYSGDPMLPQTRVEWLDNFQFAGTIALGFIVGHVVARMLRGVTSRRLGKP